MREQVERAGGRADRRRRDAEGAGRRRQTAMPEQQLNGADVGTGFQQVDGKGVSERMRRHRLRETAAAPGLPARAVDDATTRRALRVLAEGARNLVEN